MISLRSRLGWGLAASLFVLFGGMFAVVAFSLHVLVEAQMLSRMEDDAEGILAAVAFVPDGFRVDPARVGPVFSRPFSGHYYVVSGRAGTAMEGGQRTRSRSLWDEDIPTMHSFPKDYYYVDGPQGQPLIMIQRNYRKAGVSLTVSVAEDLTHVEAGYRRALGGFAALCVASFMVLVVVQRLIVARTLSPLEDVRADVAALERGEINQLRETVPAEVLPLVAEFNRMLDGINRRVKRSRNALGNLAHALKTPLTVLSQVGERDDVAACPEVADTIREETGTIGRLIERELKRARLAGMAAPGVRVNIKDAADSLVRALSRVYEEKSLRFDLDVDGHAGFPGDREDMLELLGNLMDNACKWAAHTVRLTVSAVEGLHITVEDDGPGCPEEELARLTERGARMDESAPGHGLGLAIVRDVAESYGGSVMFDRSDGLGGLRVTVNLAA